MFGRFLAIMILLQAVMLRAAVINVPADQPAIQAGILSAGAGDTVLVARGTYFENINYRGRNITVASRYLLTGDLADIDSTVIDGSAPVHPDTASCVLFVSGEDSGAVLCGFTLTRGSGTVWPDEHSSGTYREGGGVMVAFSSPVIRNNRIIANTVSGGGGLSGGGGGAIRAGDGAPLILNNAIACNRGADYGGGIVLNYCGGTVRNNIIFHNSGGAAYGGGGIWLNGEGIKPRLIENNTIVNNISGSSGGGIFYFGSASATVRNNIIWGNTTPQMTAGKPATYCDIQGGWTGDGNIDQDPAFSSCNSFVLGLSSPCIDSGDSTAALNDPGDPGNPGSALWPARGGLRGDIGAYGGPGSCSHPRLPTVVLAASPASGSSKIALDSPMAFSFSGPVDTASLSFSFSDPAIPLTPLWNGGGDTVTLSHALLFDCLTGYVVRLDALNDTTNAPVMLLPDSVWFLTTDTVRPRLKSTTPPDGASDVSLTAKLYLKFTKQVSRASLQFDFSDTSIHFTRAWYLGDTLTVLSHAQPFAAGATYTLTVTAVVDIFGNELGGSDVPNPFSFTALFTGVEGGSRPAEGRFRIGGAYPNPLRAGFSPSLEIEMGSAGPITVGTYNALGQLVDQTAEKFAAAGRHDISLKTSGLAPGVYFIRVRAGAVSAIRRLTILR